MRHVQITVKGLVQGVFFRKHTKEIAQSHGIRGFVHNKNDGSVYIEASGTMEQIQQLINWCNKGPRNANVTSVNVSDIIPQEYHKFDIR